MEPRLLLYLVLGTEWLFRARKGTGEDIEAEIRKIEARLWNPADPILWPGQEPAFEAMAAKLRSSMIGDRYLISLRRFAFPDKHWFLKPAARELAVKRMPQIALVAKKRGPIPRIGPRLAAVMVEGLMQQFEARRTQREAIARALADLLLLPPETDIKYRACGITRPEYRGWLELIDRPISDPYPEGPEEEPRTTVQRWLMFRLKRYCASQGITKSWEHLLAEIDRDPVWTFSPIATHSDISRLYALPWG